MDFLSQGVARLINGISDTTGSFWHNIDISQYSVFQIALDILLVTILFYWLIMIIRGTRATNIMVGVGVMAVVFALSRMLNLVALGWILDRFLTVILIAIPIIFQQEIRRGLEKLGRTKFFIAQEAKEIDIVRSELINGCFDMAEKKIGALIVLRGEVSLKEYIDTGVILDSHITEELLLSLFARQSPLHDGAIIIDYLKIVAAGCVLPHSFKEYGHSFGTRHKAALGLSESTDAHVFVVSEEKGTVSYVFQGSIEKDITPERMQIILTRFFLPKKFFKAPRRKKA